MAHFAQLDENNVVIQVIVVDNKDIMDANGVEQESIGVAFCENLLGGRWKQTSYNRKFRKHYAAPGYTYHEDIDAFIEPKPPSLNSWNLNKETGRWEAPVPMPTTELNKEIGEYWAWDEENLTWVVKIEGQP